MIKRRHRFTERERASRIYKRINKAGERGVSAREIARKERISLRRAYHYLRQLRRKRGREKIDRLGGRYYRLRPFKVETRRAPARSRMRRPVQRIVELRGYLNYSSSLHTSSNIEIDCVVLVPNDSTAILAGKGRIEDKVEAHLGEKLASMLHFGVSRATPESANHFLYRRQGGDWVEF